MEFKVNREVFTTTEVVLDGSSEQPVELDYILPDYFPDIFRVLKCELLPKVVSHVISGEKLTFELIVCVKITYTSENSNAVNCIEQKLNYTKSVDLGKKPINEVVTLTPKCDYVNCRVVNQRRVDLRGSISVKTRVCADKEQQAIVDADGSNIQLKKELVTFPSVKLNTCKRVAIVEDLELSISKPAIETVIKSEAMITAIDKKVISNKIIAKGEALVSMLYTCVVDDEDTLDSMKFTIPFSQIIDFEGVDERFDTRVEVEPVGCEIIPRTNVEETREVECEITLLITCSASKYETTQLVTDCYSTTHNCEFSVSDAKLDNEPIEIDELNVTKAVLDYSEGDIVCVHDASVKVFSLTSRLDIENSSFNVMGNVSFCVIAKNSQGCPIYLEADIPLEQAIKLDKVCEDSYIEPKASIVNCTYNLTSDNSVEVKAEIKISGYIYVATVCEIISDIEVDVESCKVRDGDYAIKLYFADEEEEVWEIGKKYSTSINAIMEENDLDSPILKERGMLLIPIIN